MEQLQQAAKVGRTGDAPVSAILIAVFAAAFSIVYLETALFHTLVYLGTYADAILAIAVALLGLSLGSVGAYFYRRDLSESRLMQVLAAIALLMPASLGLLAMVSARVGAYAIFLVLPFALAAFILGLSFAKARSASVYAIDLSGAAIGLVAAALLIEFASMEASLIAAGVPAGLALVAIAARARRGTWLLCGTLLTSLSLGAFLYQTQTDGLNFLHIAKPNKRAAAKSYSHAQKKDTYDVLMSHSSLAGRIDVLAKRPKNAQRKRVSAVRVYHDGLLSDTFKFRPVDEHSADPRVPWGFIENPDSLIIGTSAEGVVNPVAGMGDGQVVGLEINPGKVAVMETEWGKRWTHDAYQHLDELHIIDARTYLKLTDRVFDHITLMNAHLGQRKARALAPEYVHTVESMVDYFEHLSDEGLLNIEEIYSKDSVTVHTNLKFVNTLRQALLEIGAENPGDHVIIYNWNKRYRQYLIKRTPYTAEQRQWMLDWIDRVHKERRARPFTARMEVVYEPGMAGDSSLEARMLTGLGVESSEYRYPPTTDDSPFPFGVYRWPPTVSWLVVGLAVYLLALGWAVFAGMRRSIADKRPRAAGVAIFVLTGLGYLAIEITLINKLQLFVGTPVVSMIATIGSMLLFSALGSYLTQRVSRERFAAVCVAIVAVGAVTLLVGDHLFDRVISPSLPVRALFTVLLIAPLATLMGMPFPMALDAMKERGAPDNAALLFAVNCAASSLVSPLALVAASVVGLTTTALIGVGFYALAVPAFALIRAK